MSYKLTTKTKQLRIQAMQQLMTQAGADGIVFTASDFIQYATNFAVDVLPWERPIFTFVTRDGTIHSIFNELSTNHLRFSSAKGTIWVPESEIYFYSEHPRTTNIIPTQHQIPDLIAHVISKAGLLGKKILCEGLGSLLVAGQKLSAGTMLQPDLALLRSLRWVKSEEELHIMRSLAKLTDWAQDRFKERYKPGVKTQVLDYEVAALIAEEASHRFPGESFDLMRCWTLSGPASASPHGDGANVGATIEKGHNIVNFVLPRLNGYYVENERTWFVGKPSSMQVRCFEAARAATQAGVAAAKTGNPVNAIDAAAFAVIKDAGLDEYIYHRTGHGVGLMLHEYPEDMAFNTRPLLSNEVFSCEPGLYVYGLGGFRIDDTVVVGNTPEVLVSTPSDIDWVTVDV